MRSVARKAHMSDIRQKYLRALELSESESDKLQARSMKKSPLSEGSCKALDLPNGKIDCFIGKNKQSGDSRFQKGAECRSSCNEGFVLRKKAPKVKKCICKNNKCRWVKNALVKCNVASGKNIGRKIAAALPWCINLEFGKKKLVRNRGCSCPLGWNEEDKCFTPTVDRISNCRFEDKFVNEGKASLNCEGMRNENFQNSDLIVPGITTSANMKNSGIMIIMKPIFEGAYRLGELDLSHNFLSYLPKAMFKTNDLLRTLNLSVTILHLIIS